MSAAWVPRRETARCDTCKAVRPFTEGKCDHCAAPLGPYAGRHAARQLANGDGVVLAPDGLTWVTWFREGLAVAERYAERLNGWLDARPLPDDLVPLTDTFTAPEPPPTMEDAEPRLLAILGKLCGPYDERLGEWSR